MSHSSINFTSDIRRASISFLVKTGRSQCTLHFSGKFYGNLGELSCSSSTPLGAVTVQLPLVEVVLLMFHLQVLVLIVLIDLYLVCLYILALIHFWLRQHFDN